MTELIPWIVFLFSGNILMTRSPCSSLLTWTEYHPLQNHQDYLHCLHDNYPQIAQVETIGWTHERKPILLLKICPNRNCGDRPVIWMDGGVHGREWISPAAVSYLARELVVMYKATKKMTRMFDWYLLTVANPDGYQHTFSTDRRWRKNKNPDYADKCRNGSGVDLNRNFGYFWDDDRAIANNPCSTIFHGDSAFSEPETRAIRDFLLKSKGKILIFNTVHAAGEKFVIPWGHTGTPYKHQAVLTEMLEEGRRAMREQGERFEIGNVMKTYGIVAHGGSPSWAAGSLGVRFAFCTELINKVKYGRTPPSNRILTEVRGFVRFSLAAARSARKILLRIKRKKNRRKWKRKSIKL